MTNAYPELPRLGYVRTSVSMTDVITYIQGLRIGAEVKRAAYIMFRNESQNGERGINNNYCGAQADSGRWAAKFDPLLAGTVVLAENQTGRERIFLAFRSWRDSISFLIDRVEARGLYIGGAPHLVVRMMIATERDLARAYHKEWVSGSASSEPGAQELANFLSMYAQAAALFRGAAMPPAAAPAAADDPETFTQADAPAPAEDADGLMKAELAGASFPLPTQEHDQ